MAAFRVFFCAKSDERAKITLVQGLDIPANVYKHQRTCDTKICKQVPRRQMQRVERQEDTVTTTLR
jgi:hypothetical protein